jgi:hypothetical protein
MVLIAFSPDELVPLIILAQHAPPVERSFLHGTADSEIQDGTVETHVNRTEETSQTRSEPASQWQRLICCHTLGTQHRENASMDVLRARLSSTFERFGVLQIHLAIYKSDDVLACFALAEEPHARPTDILTLALPRLYQIGVLFKTRRYSWDGKVV